MFKIIAHVHWQNVPVPVGDDIIKKELAQNVRIHPINIPNWWVLEGDYINPCALSDPVWPITVYGRLEALSKKYPGSVWSLQLLVKDEK